MLALEPCERVSAEYAYHSFLEFRTPLREWRARMDRQAQGYMPRPRQFAWQPCFFSWKLDWSRGLWVIDAKASQVFWHCIWKKIEATQHRPWYEQHFETPELSLDRFRWKATRKTLSTFCLSEEFADHPLVFECGPGRKYKIDPSLPTYTQQQYDSWMGMGLIGAIPGFASRVEWAGADTEYFVKATGGSDLNNGLTEGAAWATIGKFITSAAGGDILTMVAGTYTQFIAPISTNKDGSSGSKTRVRPKAGDTVILQPSGDNSAIHFYNRAHVHWEIGRTGTTLIIDGSSAAYSNGSRIVTSDGPADIRIRNVESRDWEANGFGNGGTRQELLDGYTHDNGTTYLDHGLYISSGNDDLTEGMHSTNNAGFGLQMWANPSITSGTMRRCRAHANGTDSANTSYEFVFGAESGENSNLLLYNLLGYDHLSGSGARGGIQIGDVGGQGADDIKLLNCNFVNNTGTGILLTASADGTIIKNVVSYGNTVANYTNNGTNTVTSNNSVSGTDPEFTNAGAGDFTIDDGSPLFDAGTSTAADGVTDDFIQTARPQGAAFDIGAYEFEVDTPVFTRFIFGSH